MRVLVLAHRLEIGGTQTNAIELAAAVRDQAGAEVTLLAAPGPAEALARARGLEVVPAPDPARHPSPAVMRALADTARRVDPDVLHTWDWPQCFDAYYGEHLLRGRPLLCSVMGMVVSRFLPRDIPLTFGTRALTESARRRRTGSVDLLEPPVDLAVNAPGVVDEAGLRRAHGIDGSRLTVGVVTRLTEWLKLESLLRTIAAVDALAAELPVRLVVAGDGPARDRVARLADRVNDRHGAPVVVLTGALLDPRPAYSVSDVVVGMGGSALRAMAFGKPLVVLGEQGFSRPLTERSAPWFLQNGWYGLGNGNLSPEPLRSQLAALLEDPDRRHADGGLGRRLVEENYDLRRSAETLDALYRRVAPTRPRRARAAAEGARTAGLLAARGARGLAGRLVVRLPGGGGATSDLQPQPPAGVPGTVRPGVDRTPGPVPRTPWRSSPVTRSSIPLVDLGIQTAGVEEEVREGFARVLAANAFVNGPDVRAFEQEFSAYVGREHCVGVGNGTDALELALRALGVGAGDRVALPANTFVATAEAVVRAGAVPELVDVDDEHLLVDVDALAEVAGRCRAVVPVHLFGQMAPMDGVCAVARRDGLAVLEDAAQCQGASQVGVPMGGFGDLAATSFYPGKNLGAFGDAGAVVTDRDDLAARVRLLANHGSDRKYEHPVLGFNSRLDTLQAVVLRAKLARLDEWNKQRQEAARCYDELLEGVGEVRRPGAAAGNEHVWHLYVVRVADRDRVLSELDAAGIGAGIHYPTPVHLTGAFAFLQQQEGSFPVAERAAREMVSLPLYPGITREQQERVVAELVRAVAARG